MSTPSPDFIPNSEFVPDRVASAPSASLQGAPDFIPNSQFVPDQGKDFGTPLEVGKTALEQSASGLTLGLSKIAETKLLGVDPKNIEAREEANPATALGSNLLGTAGLITLTDGLGLAVEGGAGLGAKILSNTAQGAVLGAANSATNDLALGDPNLNASKLLSHAGLSALYGGAIGGLGTAALETSTTGLKNLASLGKDFASPELSISPESLGAVDQIRMGLLSGMQTPEAQANLATKVSSGISSLTDLASMGNLEKLGAAGPEVDAFQVAKKDLLKHFGDGKTSRIDPEEILSYLTNPAEKNTTQQTTAFNHFVKAVEGLNDVKLSDPDLNVAFKQATANLQDWQGLLADANFTSPYSDIEYGGPKHLEGSHDPKTTAGKLTDSNEANHNEAPSAYSTKYDLKPGTEMRPNYAEGVTLGADQGGGGANAVRVPSFGSERVSPFQYEGPSIELISQRINDYQQKVLQSMAEQHEGLPFSASDMSDSLAGAKESTNQLQNMARAKSAIEAPGHEINPLVAFGMSKVPYIGKPSLALYAAIRKYGGDGGLYRLGNSLATPLKVLDGVAGAVKKVDDRIGDKARLIFTGSSAQARKIHE